MRPKYVVCALTFEYGGIAPSELRAAKAVAARAGVREHRFVRLPDLREAGDIWGERLRGLPPTYIPLRNSIFYSFAASIAEEVGASLIVGGHNREDERVFADVKEAFFEPLERALRAGSPALRRNRLRIVRPLKELTKPEVIGLASLRGVPLELTWSCHSDGEAHCWRCEGCRARTESFRRAEVTDPLAPRRGKIT